MPSLTVSNLVPIFEDAGVDGGGSFEPAEAATVVEQVVHATEAPRVARLVSPPERFDAAEPVERRSAFSYDLTRDAETTWAEERHAVDEVDFDALRRRDIAKELLRARLIAIAEQREHRSAYELAFLMLVAAVSVLLAAPPLVQVLLAAHGTQA
jgi:hypothetical protein